MAGGDYTITFHYVTFLSMIYPPKQVKVNVVLRGLLMEVLHNKKCAHTWLNPFKVTTLCVSVYLEVYIPFL